MMQESGSGNFSDINPEPYEFEIMRNITNGNLELDLISQVGNTNGALIDPMMTLINPNEETLAMDQYQYLQESNYLPENYQNYEIKRKFPPSDPAELCNTDYPGAHNFEVLVDPNGMKNPWEYSPSLNKIYIDMKHKFPINFSVKNESQDQKFFVRVMPMFEEDRYFQELVHRCLSHELPLDPTNHGVPEYVTQHIIRCGNSEAQYFGDKNQGKRLSIVIPLGSPQAGTDSVKEFFYFVCKNSCPGGMNRRPIQVVFTLEDDDGAVLGRRVLRVRICSCPKRDREKEETKREKPEPMSKKKKIEKKPSTPPPESDSKLYNLQVGIYGKENYKYVLKTCQMLMGNELLQAKNPAAAANYRRSRDEITNLLNEIAD